MQNIQIFYGGPVMFVVTCYRRFLCNLLTGRGLEAFIRLKELQATVFLETLHKMVNSWNFIDVHLMTFDANSTSI